MKILNNTSQKGIDMTKNPQMATGAGGGKQKPPKPTDTKPKNK